MAGDTFLRLENGKEKSVKGTDASTGIAQAGDIVSLDNTGKLDVSLLPVGVGPDVAVLEASEDVGVGDYVNIFDDGGTPKVRLADNSNGRDAHGYIPTGGAATTGNNATVYFEGPNPNLTGLTAGARQYLGTGGNATATPLDPTLPANNGSIHQFLGIAVNATTINTDIDDCTLIES